MKILLKRLTGLIATIFAFIGISAPTSFAAPTDWKVENFTSDGVKVTRYTTHDVYITGNRFAPNWINIDKIGDSGRVGITFDMSIPSTVKEMFGNKQSFHTRGVMVMENAHGTTTLVSDFMARPINRGNQIVAQYVFTNNNDMEMFYSTMVKSGTGGKFTIWFDSLGMDVDDLTREQIPPDLFLTMQGLNQLLKN